MASESEIMMISCKGKASEEGSEEWKEMSKKVKEACENQGCFLLKCDDMIPKAAVQEMLKSLKTLFDLPQETKQQHVSPKSFRGYDLLKLMNTDYEIFGIDDVVASPTVQTFTNLMWPQGNPHFCETLKGLSLKMSEVCLMMLKMIGEGYGLSKHYISDLESMQSIIDIRLNKYRTSESKGGSNGHTDKATITILCQDEVPGLQVLTKTGKWIDVTIPQGWFLIIVGETLKGWSNGRLHAARHRVMMRGEKERYSIAVFVAPKDEMTVEVPDELVDDIHPLRYRPFKYGEFFSFFTSTRKDNALEVFAGL